MCKVLPPRLFHWTIFPTSNLHTINNLRTLSNLNITRKLSTNPSQIFLPKPLMECEFEKGKGSGLKSLRIQAWPKI